MSEFEKYRILFEHLECDRSITPPLDAIYGMAQTDDNRESVLNRIEELYASGASRRVLLLGEDACSGYSGFRSWMEYVAGRKVIPERAVTGVLGSSYVDPHGTIRVHSGTESAAAVSFCRGNQLKNIAVVAPEFHMVRTFIHFVTATLKTAPDLNIWPIIGSPLSWDEVVAHSQGVQRATRRDIASDEYRKVFTYSGLAKIAHVCAYIRRRNTNISI